MIAESGDPFALLRVIDLVARVERGRPVRIDDLVDALNAAHLDWLFTKVVVADALGVQERLLEDRPELRPDMLAVHLAQLLAVQADRAIVVIVEPQQQVHQRALA